MMIRRNMLLASAGIVALATPALAQQPSTQPTVPDTTQGPAAPTEGNSAGDAGAVANTAQQEQPVDTSNIIITATRRNQALSNVPMAVSAVTADTLRNSGASDIRALQQLSPSLQVNSTTSEGASTARIRGIGTVGDNPGLEGSVATYIDGVYRSRTGIGLTELGPLDRIEVLRGPQGTLFGRNASAGVISVITAKPQFNTFVSGAATVGNYNLRRFEASVNAPLSKTIASRLDGVWMKRSGFLKDVISGRRVNDRDRWLLRGQLLFEPTDVLSVRLIADYSKRNEECCAATYLPTRTYVAGVGSLPSGVAAIERALGAVINDDTYRREVSISPGRNDNNRVHDGGLSGEVNYDFGGVKMTSISAWRQYKAVSGLDADFNNLDILYRADDGGYGNKFDVFTQELRFNGNALGDRLDWLVGAFYGNEDLTRRDNLSYGADTEAYFDALIRASSPTLATFPGYGALVPFLAGVTNYTLANDPRFAAVPPAYYPFITGTITSQLVNTPLTGSSTRDVFRQNDKNFALFTHNIVKLTDQLSLTLGLRYTMDRKKLSADLNSTFQCANYLGNIARLRALAAATGADPTGNGGLNAAISGLAAGYAAALAQLASAPCVLNSINGTFNDGRRKENKWSGTAVLSYKPFEQLLTYASFSRGYKAGGFNLDRQQMVQAAPSLSQLEFEQEMVDAYELGAKYHARGFDVNVALFQQDFRNFQLNLFNGVNFVVANINSCSKSLGGADTNGTPGRPPVACGGSAKPGVRSRGLEVETFFRPMRDVNGSLGLTIVNSKYRRDLIGADGNAIPTSFFQLPGQRLSNAPRTTITGSLGWTPPIGGSGMHALFYIDGRHVSTYNTGSDLDIEKTQKSYAVFNARTGIRGPGDTWAIELWAQNLFNEKYKQIAFDAFAQGSCTQRGADAGYCSSNPALAHVATQLYGTFLGDPRTFGLTARYKWSPAAPLVAPEPAPLPPPPPASQTCADGSVVAIDAVCPPPPPPPPPPAPVERGERGL